MPEHQAPLPVPERHLMGPGPSNVPADVLSAMAQPTVGHLDPYFIDLMDEVREQLQYAFQTASPHVFTLSGPGSAGMESCMLNLIQPGQEIAVGINGVFGLRLAEIGRRAGARVHEVTVPWGQALDPDTLEATLKAHPEVGLVAMVHAETSTGACSDVATLAAIARSHGCLTLVDCVTSLGGIPLKVDDWGLDAVYSGSQKCLSCVPGLSPIALSARAWEVIESRPQPPSSWFLDFALLAGYFGQGVRRAYHHTAPVNSIYAWHQALARLQSEGLENAWARHRAHHLALAAGLAGLGLEFVVAPEARLPQLNAVRIPDGVDDAGVRATLLAEADLEIGAGLGDFAGQVWRIGLMGINASEQMVLLCLKALGHAMADNGGDVEPDAGHTLARQHYATRADAVHG